VTRSGRRSTTATRGGASRWIRSSFFAWAAILALVLQLGAASAPRAMASPAEAEAVAALGVLSALLGPNVALCLHEDGSAPGSPGHSQHDCCIDCALCQAAGLAAALVPPDAFPPARFALYATPLGVANETKLTKPRVSASAQARAPPPSA
jgi:hypothetical protein